MKRIVIKKVKDNLKNLGVDELQIDIIVNTIDLYNDTVKQYKETGSNGYMLYQLSIQVFKVIESVQKNSKVSTEENDKFTTMLNEIKNKRIETRN